MKTISNFAGQNWLITPAALAVEESTPASLTQVVEGQTTPTAQPLGVHQPSRINDQKWLLVLSGVVIADLKGNSSTSWYHETLFFHPDLRGPLNFAINHFSIPKPPDPPENYITVFSVEQWVPFVSLSSIFNQNQSINSGFAVDRWYPKAFDSGTNISTHQQVANIFTGINVDVAVRDKDAYILRIGYYITLLGRIVFTENIIQ